MTTKTKRTTSTKFYGYGKQNLDACERVLQAVGRPMRVAEMITEGENHEVYFPTRSATPTASIARDLAGDVKSNPQSRFVRLDRGLFGLRDRDGIADQAPARPSIFERAAQHTDPCALGHE